MPSKAKKEGKRQGGMLSLLTAGSDGGGVGTRRPAPAQTGTKAIGLKNPAVVRPADVIDAAAYRTAYAKLMAQLVAMGDLELQATPLFELLDGAGGAGPWEPMAAILSSVVDEMVAERASDIAAGQADDKLGDEDVAREAGLLLTLESPVSGLDEEFASLPYPQLLVVMQSVLHATRDVVAGRGLPGDISDADLQRAQDAVAKDPAVVEVAKRMNTLLSSAVLVVHQLFGALAADPTVPMDIRAVVTAAVAKGRPTALEAKFGLVSCDVIGALRRISALADPAAEPPDADRLVNELRGLRLGPGGSLAEFAGQVYLRHAEAVAAGAGDGVGEDPSKMLVTTLRDTHEWGKGGSGANDLQAFKEAVQSTADRGTGLADAAELFTMARRLDIRQGLEASADGGGAGAGAEPADTLAAGSSHGTAMQAVAGGPSETGCFYCRGKHGDGGREGHKIFDCPFREQDRTNGNVEHAHPDHLYHVVHEKNAGGGGDGRSGAGRGRGAGRGGGGGGRGRDRDDGRRRDGKDRDGGSRRDDRGDGRRRGKRGGRNHGRHSLDSGDSDSDGSDAGRVIAKLKSALKKSQKREKAAAQLAKSKAKLDISTSDVSSSEGEGGFGGGFTALSEKQRRSN